MAKGSEELTNRRREEILSAARQLYDEMPFKDIALKEIADRTSFTRTSIYNYFTGKEEIFMSLLQSEFSLWADDIDAMDSKDFAVGLSATLGKRKCMLKMMSMNLYEIEDGSRIERLTEFKTAYGRAVASVKSALKRYFPSCGEEFAEEFVYSFFPFLFGVYPYTEVTEKQKTAMKAAGVPYREFVTEEISRMLIEKLVRSVN